LEVVVSLYCPIYQKVFEFDKICLMQLHLFGAATPTGEALKEQLRSTHTGFRAVSYSRRDPSLLWADFSDPDSFCPGGDPAAPGMWISFGPIWLLAPFLEHLSLIHPERLQALRGVIACSSSSAITKRFAANCFDRELVARLTTAEDKLLATCQRLELPCRILRPALIYGRGGVYLDRNLNRLIALMRRLPVLPLPAHTGLRQPIHAAQLAAVVLELVRQFSNVGWDPQLPRRIALGGDSELSYASMLYALQQTLPYTDRARRCLLLPIPTRLFQAAAAPLLLHSPKAFEAVLRISADLSGFTPAHQLLGEQSQDFPVLPLI
jgi:hypothetical protein